MATNDFLPFATGGGANVQTQTAYAANSAVGTGYQVGIADPAQANKTFRQGTFFSAVIGSLINSVLNANVNDDGVISDKEQLFWRTLLNAGYFVDAGAANIYLVNNPTGLTFPAPTAGARISLLVANANTGSATLNWMSANISPIVTNRGAALSGGELLAGRIVELTYDGVSWQLPAQTFPLIAWQFDEATPPASPQTLLPGQRGIITFGSVGSIPFHVNVSLGVYKVSLVVTADNTTDANILWQPNDVNFTNAFSGWSLENTDQTISAVGSATTQVSTVANTVSPFVSTVPSTVIGYQNKNAFYFDMFNNIGGDTVNDIGPWMSEYLVSTYTAAKMIKQSGGITGGPSIGFSRWNDTTTVWTSLGTILDQNGTLMSGTAIVERLA